MNEKQKAKELVEEFIDLLPYSNKVYETAKKFALICIDKTINSHRNLGSDLYKKIGTDSYASRCVNHDILNKLENVKTEIQNFEP